MTLEQQIRRIVAEMIGQGGQSRHGTVSSVDPNNGLVKVQYDEGDPANGVEPTTSGWLPIAQTAAGNGWSVVCLPTTGTQVFVAADMGDIEHGVVLGAVHSTMQPIGKITPYQATASIALVPGEPVLIHSSGASLRLTAGAVEIHGALRVDGDILASGQITDLNGIHGSLDVLREDYNAHGHATVPSLGGLSPPSKPTP